VAIGRFPVNTAEEASIMADKVVAYEADPEFGPWRNRLLFLADDEIKRGSDTGYDCSFLLAHTSDTEDASRSVPEIFDREKVYMVEYPLSSADLKPLATAAYIEWMSEGYLLSNYLGHGGVDKMADEALFVLADATPGIVKNGKRLHLFSAYSCSIGSFDLTEKNSLAEVLIKMDGGGAIASFSSDAPAFAGVSFQLNVDFIQSLLPGGHVSPPLGVAAMVAKSPPNPSMARLTNDEKYTLLGDPGLHFAIPELDVRFNEGNDVSFQRGVQTKIRGEVLDDSGELATWFHGLAEVAVRGMADTLGYTYTDTACPHAHPDTPRLIHASYTLSGPTFYRGAVDVSAGTFEIPFQVPLDTRVGDLGRVSAYVYDPSAGKDGSGGDDSVHVTSEPPGYDPEDDEGPSVRITVSGAELRDGHTFAKNSLFEIELQDPSGLNLQQNDDFFSIHVVFDRGRALDLTSLFEYDRNSYQKGSISFRLDDFSQVFVSEGPHELTLRAADNLNNRTELEYQIFVVGEGEGLAFSRPVLNYPNPFDPDVHDETEILVDITGVSARVTVQIMTNTGRRIRQLEATTAERGFSIRFPWDGRDADGDPVANGVYLVRAVAETEDGSESVESIGKAVVIRGAR